MAMPYPEGEVFFKRSALKIAKGNGEHPWSFNPDNAKDFASHILVEYIYNRPDGHDGKRCYSVYSEVGGSKYYRPSSFNIMFSNTQEKSETPAGQGHKPRGVEMKRIIQVETLSDAKEYRDNANGGPDKVTILPIPVGKDEKYMFIDLVVPVRAIYLPLAQKVDNLDPDLCTYIMIDFRFRKGVEMMFTGYYPGGDGMSYRYGMNRIYNPESMEQMIKKEAPTHPQHKPQPFSYKEGLGRQAGRTLQIDLRGVYNLLIVPRQLRSPDKGLYKPANPDDSLIRNHPEGITTIFNKTPAKIERDFQLLDYSKVISDHFGVDVTWQPYEYNEQSSSLVSQIFFLGVESGLNLIPVVGPLVSTGFSIFMEAVSDPEEFAKKDILKLKDIKDANGKLVGGDVIKDAVETAKDIAKNLAKKGKGKTGLTVIKLATS
ncbi:hypothetical protein PCL_09635 [Purpureocillium lilacinum]|uniref:Uncharacterized protein n=1 Tax=Purpureocillium lilacinum TaxID=33203 RepID=A0A2U3DQF4_PURLI|nr:hypothetical protein PCL_09635 [Purpureocillium lilacinum]